MINTNSKDITKYIIFFIFPIIGNKNKKKINLFLIQILKKINIYNNNLIIINIKINTQLTIILKIIFNYIILNKPILIIQFGINIFNIQNKNTFHIILPYPEIAFQNYLQKKIFYKILLIIKNFIYYNII